MDTIEYVLTIVLEILRNAKLPYLNNLFFFFNSKWMQVKLIFRKPGVSVIKFASHFYNGLSSDDQVDQSNT